MGLLQLLVPNVTWTSLVGVLAIVIAVLIRFQQGFVRNFIGRNTRVLRFSNILLLAGLILLFGVSFLQNWLDTLVEQLVAGAVVLVVLVGYLLFVRDR